MSEPLVECVPNFSEGRDAAVIKSITDRIESVPGVRLLDVDPGPDTNRTVVTFVGSPAAVEEAAFRAIAKAAEVIDMSRHSGAHPRMGATDVCPFVPVDGIGMAECAEIARRLGKRVGEQLGIPVYLYEEAASRPERRNLASVRKGEYEGLADKLARPEWAPDFGPATMNVRSGATIIGAREFLIAWNIDLNTRDKSQATDIAYELREIGRSARAKSTSAFKNAGAILKHGAGAFRCGSCDFVAAEPKALFAHTATAHGYDLADLSRAHGVDPENLVGTSVKVPGLFRHVKAIGWYVPVYDRAQVSINLTNFRVTPLADIYDAARRLADERGLLVTGAEIVGMVPMDALLAAGRHYLKKQGRPTGVPVRDILETAIQSLGLRDAAPFRLEEKVLGWREPAERALVRMRTDELVHEVSRESPAPGGGSVAALAGALGAALASMVANLAAGRPGYEAATPDLMAVAEEAQQLKDALLVAVDADTDAFAAFMEAKRLPEGTPDEKAARAAAMLEGLKTAARVPLRTAELGLAAIALAGRAAEKGNPASLSDAGVGAQMAWSAVVGGLLNVRINLRGLSDAAFVAELEARCAAIEGEGRAKVDAVLATVAKRIAAM